MGVQAGLEHQAVHQDTIIGFTVTTGIGQFGKINVLGLAV